MILFFLIFTATFRPATPTVGDLVTIEFQHPVVLDPSAAYEVVSQKGNRVVVRTFEPKTIALSGVSGGVRFRNLNVPVRSVLKPKDKLEPAPLQPPRQIPYPREPFVAIGIAALVAIIAWIAVFLLARSRIADRRSQECFRGASMLSTMSCNWLAERSPWSMRRPVTRSSWRSKRSSRTW